MRYQLVVFDIDGTLIDSVPALEATLRHLVAEAGLPEPDPVRLRESFGMPGDGALRHLGLPGGETAVLHMLETFLERQHLVCVFRGVETLLDGLRDCGCELGIVTAQSRSEMAKLFTPFGLLDRFAHVVNSDEVERHKPAPDQLLECLRRAGVAPGDALYVGDNAQDAECAAAAGVDFALACWREDYLREPVPCVGVFHTPEQLLEFCRLEPRTHERAPWIALARELQGMAQSGLMYTKDKYDAERYVRIREIAADMLALVGDVPREQLDTSFLNEDGYATPKLDVRAVVFDEQGRICLAHEMGYWALPGGWCDQGETVTSNVVKEAREEAGLVVVPERVIAIQEHNLHNAHPFAWGIVKVFVLCRNLGGGEFHENIETNAVGWFGRDELPELHPAKSTREQVKLCFAAYDAGGAWEVVCD